MLSDMSAAARAAAIVLAAGAGRRLGGNGPKAFLTIGGRSILSVAAGSAAACSSVDMLVVAVPGGLEGRAADLLADLTTPFRVIEGSASRQSSVRAALAAVPADVEVVAVHDAARPFAPPQLFDSVIEAVASGADAAIPVIPVADTVKRLRDGVVLATEPRDDLGLAQTPQAFRAAVLRDAHASAATDTREFSDDAALIEWLGIEVRAIPGDPTNFKITTIMDLARAEARMRGDDG